MGGVSEVKMLKLVEKSKTTYSLEMIAFGSIVCDQRLIDSWKLEEEDFENPVYREGFRIVQSCQRNGIKCTPGILQSKIDGDRMASDQMTVKELINLAWMRGYEHSSPDTGKLLKEQTTRRNLIELANNISELSIKKDVLQVMQFIQEQLNEIRNSQATEDVHTWLDEANKKTIDSIESGNTPEIIPTGSQKLTSVLGGYRRGELVIMAGRPSMGKSMVAQSLSLKTARQGRGVLMFSLEMGASELSCRSLADTSYSQLGSVAYQNIRSHNLSERDRRKIKQAAEMHEKLPFSIIDKPGLSLDDISREISQQKKLFKTRGSSLDVVVVDHMGHIKPVGLYVGNKTAEVGEISGGLLTIAKQFNVAVLAVCQLNRAADNRDDKRPTLSDLRYSGDIEQDAHAVIFVYRDAYYLERTKMQDPLAQQALLEKSRNEIELIIAKNRNGPTSTLKLFGEPASNVVRDER